MEIPNKLASGNPYEPYPLKQNLGVLYSCEHNPYNSLKLHEDMMRDLSILKCKSAIFLNKHLFENKVVLEVNCGTAILSMFIASQGAKTVIGIEPSPMAEYARINVKKNNLSNIHVVEQSVDKINTLPLSIEKVDIIVCQWQAYLLFDKKLLTSLLGARDRWLKSSGFMFPDIITLCITGAEYESVQRDSFMKLKLAPFNFAALGDVLCRYPRIENVSHQQIVTNSTTVRKMNLRKMSLEDFSFSENFTLTCLMHSPVHVFLLYFETMFTKGHKIQKISSSPFELCSRWKQIVLGFENELTVYANEQIKGTFKMKADEKKGFLNFYLAVDFWGAASKTQFSNEYVL